MEQEKQLPATVEQYIAGFPPEIRERMNDMRRTILGAAPGVQEKISWGMATFFAGKRRMHFAGNKKHIGLYPGAEAVRVFASELEPYTTTKGGIQLPYARPLPLALVERIARYALGRTHEDG